MDDRATWAVLPLHSAHEQVVEEFLVELDTALITNLLPNTFKFGFVECFKADLMTDATQEGLIRQFQWVHIGGKDEDNFKGDGEMQARTQVHEVLAILHGHNPAVQQVGRRNFLATQIVDHENAVIGLELKWRLVLL